MTAWSIRAKVGHGGHGVEPHLFLGVPAGGGDGVWMHQCVERLHVAAVTGGEPPDGDRL